MLSWARCCAPKSLLNRDAARLQSTLPRRSFAVLCERFLLVFLTGREVGIAVRIEDVGRAAVVVRQPQVVFETVRQVRIRREVSDRS